MNSGSGSRIIRRRLRASHDGTVKERGSRTPGTGSQFFIGCQHTWRPARRFLTKVLRACRRSGLRTGPWPCPRSQPRRGRTRPAISRSASSPPGQPRRSAGRADQTAVVLRYARAAELALASRARGSRDPGRRRRSRPTLTTPRESVPRRTGRGRHRTEFHGCQGLFSRNPWRYPRSCGAAIRDLSTLERMKIPARVARVRDDARGCAPSRLE